MVVGHIVHHRGWDSKSAFDILIKDTLPHSNEPLSWIQRHVHVVSSGWLLWLACLSKQCWISFKEDATLQHLGLMNYCYSHQNATSPQKVNLWHYLDVRVFHVAHVDENMMFWTWPLAPPSLILLIHLLRLSRLHPTIRNPNFKVPGVAARFFLPLGIRRLSQKQGVVERHVGVPNLGIKQKLRKMVGKSQSGAGAQPSCLNNGYHASSCHTRLRQVAHGFARWKTEIDPLQTRRYLLVGSKGTSNYRPVQLSFWRWVWTLKG